MDVFRRPGTCSTRTLHAQLQCVYRENAFWYGPHHVISLQIQILPSEDKAFQSGGRSSIQG